MELGEQYNVDFIDLDYEGRGVCKLESNFPIFVPNALKGERGKIEITEIKKNFGQAKLIKLYEKSPYRVAPKCPYYDQCGGCNLMHLDYNASLEYKTKLVKDTVRRIASITPNVLPCVGMENNFYYRNKLEFHFSFNNQKIRAGFYNEKTHTVVDIDSCLNEPSIATDIIRFLKSIFKILGVPIYKEKDNRGCVRHVIIRMNQKNEIMVIFVTNTHYLKKDQEIIEALTNKFKNIKSIALSFQPANNNVHIGEKTTILWGKEYLEEELLGIKYNISPESFFQVNHTQTERLYLKVLEYAKLTGKENVIDAYCGIGSISLCLAKSANHVYGIEIIEKAVENARLNAIENKIKNTTFIYGPCEEAISDLVDKKDIDLLVVDPPRKGMDKKFIEAIGPMKIKKIIYVSCNIRTMSRDLVYLSEYGYEVNEITPFDMFPNTTHVETVVCLSRKKVNDRINFDINIEALPDRVSKTATYAEIKAYVLEHYGFKVSSLYIAQIKDKHGIKERENYNIGEGKSKELICPPEKEEAITNALKHFNMI